MHAQLPLVEPALHKAIDCRSTVHDAGWIGSYAYLGDLLALSRGHLGDDVGRLWSGDLLRLLRRLRSGDFALAGPECLLHRCILSCPSLGNVPRFQVTLTKSQTLNLFSPSPQ